MMWETAKLGEICNFEGGSQPPKKEFLYEPADGYVRFLQIRDFKSNKNITYIPIAKKNRLCSEDDILIGRYGASVGQILVGLSGAYNVALMKTIPNEEFISKGWLHAYLTSPLFQKPLMEVSSRSAQNGFSKDAIYDFDVPLPPIAEQQRIVAKLDAVFAEINETIEISGKKYDELENLFNSYMEKTFNSDEFPKAALSQVSDFVGGSQPPKSVFEYKETESNIRLIQIRDYKSDKHIVYIPKNKAKRFCKKDDVMIGRYGPPIFQILRGIEGSYNVALMKAVPKDVLLNDYLFYFPKNPKIQNFVIKKSIRAAGQSGVNKEALEPYLMHLPPISIQMDIIQQVIKFESSILEAKNLYKIKLKNLNVLKSAILAQGLQSEAA